VYDTTRLRLDRGVHVHTRKRPGPDSPKEVDRTFRSVRLLGANLPEKGIVISELDAIYFMVSSVMGFEMKQVSCTHCGETHLDRDWFSVHPHRRHLCVVCGRYFRDVGSGVGNPIIGVREALGVRVLDPTPSPRALQISQADYPGGIQLWGSNPALVWTSQRPEESGIHVHAFRTPSAEPDLDDTFSQVTVDGEILDPALVRILMAQSALPHLQHRVRSIDCPACGATQFDTGASAFTPCVHRTCLKCNHTFVARGRLRKLIANPLIQILEALAAGAPRSPQAYGIDLPPEAPHFAL
jgi:hypothetical protein